MQQIPPVPVPQRNLPNFELNPSALPPTAPVDSARIVVNSLQLSGVQVFAESDLLALTGFSAGSLLSLSELRSMAAAIADFYHQHGYFVAQAYLPAQDIQNGVITIAVMEGRYGKVTLNNQSPVSTDLAQGLLRGLNSGDAVTTSSLETPLLLLSDLPGVRVSSTLTPGATMGSSDLMVDLAPGERVSGSIDADSAGNRYTGANRVGATVNWNEPLGLGDVASLRALSSGEGLNYLRGSYQMQFGRATAGVAYSALRYKLGQEFESLGAHGTQEIASLYGSYPLIRSRNSNLYAGLVLEDKTFQDIVDTSATVTDKRAQVLTANLNGEQRDAGGISGYSLAWSAGNIDMQTPAMQAIDAATAQSNGHFNKLGFRFTRLQGLGNTFSLWASLSGQLASKNLDVSEKMELGGMYAVRAYPEGEAYADQGYLLTLEARVQLAKFSEQMPGQLQLIGFVDTGSVDINRSPWSAGANRRTLSGAGLGLNWSETNNFMVRAYYAVKVGDEVAKSAPDASGRFWIQAVKYF